MEQAAIASRIETEFLTLEIATEKISFHLDGHFKEQVDKINHELEVGKTHFKAPELAKKVHEIEENFHVYAKDLFIVVTLQKEHDHLLDEVMFPDGEKIVEDIDKIYKNATQADNRDAMGYAASAREHILLGRLYLNVMVGRRNEAAATKAIHEFEKSTIAFKSLGAAIHTSANRQLFAEIQNLFHEYTGAFEKVHEDELKIRNLMDHEMHNAAEIIVEDLEWLEAKAAELESEMRVETQDVILVAEEVW